MFLRMGGRCEFFRPPFSFIIDGFFLFFVVGFGEFFSLGWCLFCFSVPVRFVPSLPFPPPLP